MDHRLLELIPSGLQPFIHPRNSRASRFGFAVIPHPAARAGPATDRIHFPWPVRPEYPQRKCFPLQMVLEVEDENHRLAPA
jgi:hypothetical protein